MIAIPIVIVLQHKGHTLRDCYLSTGAGYLVILTGTIVTMPGLPKHPAAMDIDIANDGTITGLF